VAGTAAARGRPEGFGRWRRSRGFFFGPGLKDRLEPIAEAVEHVVDGLAARHAARQFGPGQQGVADGVGGDPGERHGGLNLGVGLGERIGQPPDVVFEFRTPVLGLFSAVQPTGVQATDAGPAFMESGGDGVVSPAESDFGPPGRTVAMHRGGFRLKPPASVAGESFGGRSNGLNDVVRRWRHARLSVRAACQTDQAESWEIIFPPLPKWTINGRQRESQPRQILTFSRMIHMRQLNAVFCGLT